MKVSSHAKQRMRQRLGANNATAERLSRIAFDKGLTVGDVAGTLKSYLEKLYSSQKSADEIRIYGRFVYIFVGRKLITVFHLSKGFWKLAEKFQRRKEKRNEASTIRHESKDTSSRMDVSRDREGYDGPPESSENSECAV